MKLKTNSLHLLLLISRAVNLMHQKTIKYACKYALKNVKICMKICTKKYQNMH